MFGSLQIHMGSVRASKWPGFSACYSFHFLGYFWSSFRSQVSNAFECYPVSSFPVLATCIEGLQVLEKGPESVAGQLFCY